MRASGISSPPMTARSGFYVYTPLRMPFGRFVFINRGFVPYDLKDPKRRQQTQVEGEVTIRGLARNPLSEKPSSMVPDNEPWKNIFYWKDLDTMAATANLPVRAMVMPFFIDADATPNAGGLPIGGVTIIDLPNNHLQYALTWYGLAAALAVVVVLWLHGRRKRPDATRLDRGGRGPSSRRRTKSCTHSAIKPPLTIRLCQPRGFCAGVDRAIQIVVLALKKYGAPVYVRHEIVHNRYVVEGLQSLGAVFIEELNEIPPSTAKRRWCFPRMACRNRCRKMPWHATYSTSTRPVRWSPRCTSRRCAISGSAAMCC